MMNTMMASTLRTMRSNKVVTVSSNLQQSTSSILATGFVDAVIALTVGCCACAIRNTTHTVNGTREATGDGTATTVAATSDASEAAMLVLNMLLLVIMFCYI
jgi:hypothetical protein